MHGIMNQLGAYAPLVANAIKALAFIIIGWIVAGTASTFVKHRVRQSSRIDDTLGGFFAALLKWLILIVVLIAVLQIFGFQATSLVAVLGAATLAIGFALQGTLADLAAGVMLIVFRPYRIDQFVDIGGTAGTVVDLNLFITELVTPDNVQIIVPNGKAWGAIITNFSAHDTRRLDLGFRIDYDDDAEQAMQVIRKVAGADSRVHADPEPWLRVVGLGESSVDPGVRLWCNAGDYWELKFEMTKQVKNAFDAAGISIPFPHRVSITKDGDSRGSAEHGPHPQQVGSQK